MTIKFNDGSEAPTLEEYVDQLEATILELKKRRAVESELADYWYSKCMELKDEMQRMRK